MDDARDALDGEDWIARLRAAEGASTLGTIGGYEIHEVVGRGAQSTVYRARETATGRLVALKRPFDRRLDASGLPERARAELAALRALAHPNVVRLLDAFFEDGRPVLVFEWIDGLPLDEWAHTQRRTRAEIIRLMLDVCDVLVHAHERGILHRDLKPANVLVGDDGAPHVLDFGLARRLIEGGDEPEGARFEGTLSHAAPELVEHGAAAADARSDVYSAGVLLYELCAGRPPYDLGGSIGSAVGAILQHEPLPFPADRQDAALEAIAQRALRKDPNERYPDAAAMRTDLERAGRGEAIRRTRSARAGTRVRRGRATIAIAAVAFVAALGLMFVRGVRVPQWTPAGTPEAAETAYRTALARFEQADRPSREWVRALTSYAKLQEAATDATGAIASQKRAVEVLARVPDATIEERIEVQDELADRLARATRWPEAEAEYREALVVRGDLLDDRRPAILSKLGSAVREQGRAEEAIPFFEEAVATRLDWLAVKFPAEAERDRNLARGVRDEGLTAENLPRVVEAVGAQVPNAVPLFMHTAGELARAHEEAGNAERAESLRAAARGAEAARSAATGG